MKIKLNRFSLSVGECGPRKFSDVQVTGEEDLEYADILSLTVISLKDLFSLIVIRKKLLYQCYFSGFLGT